MKEILIEFGLPVLVLLTCAVLLIWGIDGEVKTALALAIGVILKGVYDYPKLARIKNDAVQSKSAQQGVKEI